MDRINNAQNINGCNQLTDEDDDSETTEPDDTSGTKICLPNAMAFAILSLAFV